MEMNQGSKGNILNGPTDEHRDGLDALQDGRKA